MYRSHGASSLNRSDEAASAHSITSSARPRDQMPNVAWFPIPLLAAHGRDIQALTKARRLSSGTFCSLACLRQADRFCRSAASLWRIALRVAASAVVRSGLMPVTGAVVPLLSPEQESQQDWPTRRSGRSRGVFRYISWQPPPCVSRVYIGILLASALIAASANP